MSQVKGYKELSAQLQAMGAAPAGAALRSAAMSAMLPAAQAAQAAAPRGNPPYNYGNRTVDPYPKRTFKGRLVAPGFASRNVVRRGALSRDKTFAKVSLGVRAEAFYAVQFIELGTSKIPKRPWLEPAFRGSTNAVDARLQDRLKQLIDRAATK
jgi:HK97 gp10 family phage protein